MNDSSNFVMGDDRLGNLQQHTDQLERDKSEDNNSHFSDRHAVGRGEKQRANVLRHLVLGRLLLGRLRVGDPGHALEPSLPHVAGLHLSHSGPPILFPTAPKFFCR